MDRHNLRCPDCGDSTSLSTYSDGHSFCHKCHKRRASNNNNEEETIIRNVDNKQQRKFLPLASNFSELADRGISKEAAEKYKIKAILNDEIKNVAHVYPYFDREGNHIGNKCRTKFKKSFFIEGDLSKSALFGQQAFPEGCAKAITLVEGEGDSAAAYQMFNYKYPVVSVKSASEAVKNVQDNYEYLNSFEKIYICFDNDKGKPKADGSVEYPGQQAAQAVAKILPLGKVHIVNLTKAKDANEYLQKGLEKEFLKEWWSAPEYTPAGIRLGKDFWEDIRTKKEYESCSYPWDSLNDLTYGIRLSEFVVVTADTGVGKTSILKEIEYWLLNHTSWSLGIMHLEETNADTGLGLMSIAANRPLHLPDIREQITEEELKVYYDKTVNSERVIVYDHFGSNAIEDLLNKIRHMAALGAKVIILDHLSIVVSDQNGDERKQLDEIATKLKTLTMELNIAVIAVIHQNRSGQIRGTAGVEQLANIVIKLFRDKESDDQFRRNVTKLLVQKNRFCGRTGPGGYLFYDVETGRLQELSKEQIMKYEAGIKEGDNLDEW